MESARRGIKSVKPLSRTGGVVAALTVGASLLAVPQASAEDTPSTRQLLDACSSPDLCEFHPQSYSTYTGPRHQVGSTAYNCAGQTNPHHDLVVLTDLKDVIPPERVFPLIGAPNADSTARKALAGVNARLTTEQLAVLVASVEAGRAPGEVARTSLRAEGLLS